MGAHRRHIIVRTTPRCVTRVIRRGRRGGGGIRGGCFQRVIKSINGGGKFVYFRLQQGIRSGQQAYLAWGFSFSADRQIRRFGLDLFQVAERFFRAEAGDIQCG